MSDRNPAVRMFPVQRPARHGRIDRQNGIERRDGPISAERERHARVEQRAKCVGGPGAIGADPLFSPPAIVDRVIRLHRSHDFISREPLDVLGAQMLGVLNAKTAIAIAIFLFDLLVDRKNFVVGPITDRVNQNL